MLARCCACMLKPASMYARPDSAYLQDARKRWQCALPGPRR
jgi:hypothetical protein